MLPTFPTFMQACGYLEVEEKAQLKSTPPSADTALVANAPTLANNVNTRGRPPAPRQDSDDCGDRRHGRGRGRGRGRGERGQQIYNNYGDHDGPSALAPRAHHHGAP